MERPILPPGLDDLAALGEAALASIPAELRRMVEGVGLRIEEFPDDTVVAEMELESPFELLGLYVGVPFGEKTLSGSAHHPDMIYLYRRPILDYWCETGEDLAHVVTHVLIHEIGHHFGLSDEAMEALEAQAEAAEGAGRSRF